MNYGLFVWYVWSMVLCFLSSLNYNNIYPKAQIVKIGGAENLF